MIKFTRLTSKQIKHLAALSRAAFLRSIERGQIDADTEPDQWRREHQAEACGLPGQYSLTVATQGQYLLILGHWLALLGDGGAAFEAFLHGGEDNERRRQLMHRLAGEVARLACLWRTQRGLADDEAARQAWNYATAIGRDKAAGRPLPQLTLTELEQLTWTLAARVGSQAAKAKKAATA